LANLLKDCDEPTSVRPDAAKPEDYYWAIRFAVSRAVSAIQGSLAEMLALGPLAQLLAELRAARKVPKATQIWVGKSVAASSLNSRSVADAADIHLLVLSPRLSEALLIGVAEVKSYRCSQTKVTRQIDNHLARAAHGLVTSTSSPPIHYAVRLVKTPLKIFIIPARWRLSRHFTFKSRGTSRFLSVRPPKPEASVLALAHRPGEWRIALRWSNEALAAAAYEIVLWCMGHLGEQVYAQQSPPWTEMTAAQAGQNAVKMTLYYALLHINDPTTLRQAIKLYNILGFGFALGSSFRGGDGRPAMLWPEDLDEILQNGRTRKGGYLDGMPPDGMPPNNRLQRPAQGRRR
jgi:hypothetical protein